MKVLILWTQWTGYMDACARELQALLGCELDIACLPRGDADQKFFEENLFKFPCNRHVMSAETLAYIERQRYALILVCGWHIPQFREIARRCRGRSVRLLCMDNQWSASMRQYAGMVAFRGHLRTLYDFAFVPGARQARFASRLGFSADEIIEGHLSCADTFGEAPRTRGSRSFLYVGRLVPAKGVEHLAKAWALYVRDNADPWTLTICGEGPLKTMFEGAPHVARLGFVQPSELPAVMAQACALVLPSVREPWGVVVQEAAKAGLGLLLTTACGAADYFLRDGLNGRLTSPGDPAALCEALEWFEGLDAQRLDEVSETSVRLGAQRSPLSWACNASRALVPARPTRAARPRTVRLQEGMAGE